MSISQRNIFVLQSFLLLLWIDWLNFLLDFFNRISKEFHHPKQRTHLKILKNFTRRGFQGEDFLRRFCLKHSFLSWALPSHPRTSELAFCFLPFHICWPQQEIDTDHCCLHGCCHWPDSAGTPLSCGFRPAFPLETVVTFLCNFSPRMQGLSLCWLTHKTEGLFFLPNWKPPGRKQNFDPSIQWIFKLVCSRNYAIPFQPTFFISISRLRDLVHSCGTITSSQAVSHATGFQDPVLRSADAVGSCGRGVFSQTYIATHTQNLWCGGKRQWTNKYIIPNQDHKGLGQGWEPVFMWKDCF